ncbi:MAG: GNAT family N-acetyltransferase [Verrucomicrobiae bacterium]|nr:GNAT family N-acetyltransferase [Verrucomicrobiae bacterium]
MPTSHHAPLPPPWRFDAPGGLRVVDVRDAEELARHAGAWAALLEASRAASPMLSYPQISAFLETSVEARGAWLCLFAYDGDALRAVFPLIAARAVGAAGFSLRFLKTPYDVMHTSGVDCLTADGDEALVEVLLAYLAKMPRAWSVLRLRELPEHSPTMTHRGKGGLGKRSVVRVSSSENYIEVPAELPDFHARISKNFRRQLQKSGRKLATLEDVRFLMREESRPLEENMRRFADAEDAGWKGRGNSSVKAEGRDFYQIAAERFRRHGWMEWNFLETAGRTIAAHYAVRIRRTVFLLKIGYDESFSACSPGNLLIERAIAHAAGRGDVDEINCVADCAWHRNWAMKKRWLHDLIILPEIPIISPLLCRVLMSKAARGFWKRDTPPTNEE